MIKPIDVEALLDQIWAQLNKAYSEHFELGYHKPQFTIVLSYEQRRALQSFAAKQKPTTPYQYDGIKETLFGHSIEIERRTPYLKGIITQRLAIEGLEVRAENQDLPRDICQDIIDEVGPTREDAGSYKRAQQDMLKGDKDTHWVKVRR